MFNFEFLNTLGEDTDTITVVAWKIIQALSGSGEQELLANQIYNRGCSNIDEEIVLLAEEVIRSRER
jgi:hypothetical protein